MEKMKAVFSNLKEEHSEYADLLKELVSFEDQFEMLQGEVKSQLTSVKKHVAWMNMDVERAKQQMQLNGKNITTINIEEVKELQVGSEDLKKKYDGIVRIVSGVRGNAKAGEERCKFNAKMAGKAAIGIAGFLFICTTAGGIAVFPMAMTGLPSSLIFGSSGMVGIGMGVPFFYTVKQDFKKCTKKNKVLYEGLNQIRKKLSKNFDVLTEICQLLKDLQDVVHRVSSYVRPSSDTESPSDVTDDDMNLIRLEDALVKLEKKCDDYLFDDIPIETLWLDCTST